MRLAVIAVAFFVCTVLPTAAQDTDPIVPGRAGAIECYTPNIVARTCRAMSTYRFLEGGEIVNDSVLHIQNNPLVLMHASTPVVMRGDLICGRVDRPEIDRLQFTIDGARAPEDATLQLRNLIEASLGGTQEVCSRYTLDGDAVAVTVFADGVERPDFADRMIWVRPEDGYTVGVADTSET